MAVQGMIVRTDTMTPSACRLMRTFCRMTMDELSVETGVTKATINRYEKGNAARSAFLQKLIEAFGRRGVSASITDLEAGTVSIRFRDPAIAAGIDGAVHQDRFLEL